MHLYGVGMADSDLNVNLVLVPSQFIDHAWKDGAASLGESCAEECTPDQLRYLLSHGERQLVRMDAEGKTVGWGVYRVDQLPNMRVFHISNMTAHNGHFETFFGKLKELAESLGCSRIRCCAKPSQERLYRMKLGFQPVYTTLEVALC